jgi:hypothetical protein
MSFHYKNTEKRVHGGKHHIQRVHVSGKRGFKSVSIGHKRKMCTVRKPLTRGEIGHIKKRKFINGLFDECYKEIQSRKHK